MVSKIFFVINFHFIFCNVQIKNFCPFIDDNEIHNNPNLHSEDQDEFEIPDG